MLVMVMVVMEGSYKIVVVVEGTTKNVLVLVVVVSLLLRVTDTPNHRTSYNCRLYISNFGLHF